MNTDEINTTLHHNKTMFRIPLKKIDKESVFCGLEYDPFVQEVSKSGELIEKQRPGVWASFEDTMRGSVALEEAPFRRGDVVKIKESWAKAEDGFVYRADHDLSAHEYKWKSSTQMPDEAVRLFILIEDVSVEHLQDISLDDIKREGIWDDYKTFSDKYHQFLCDVAYPETFKKVWNAENKKDYCWEENPYVWVISFSILKLLNNDK